MTQFSNTLDHDAPFERTGKRAGLDALPGLGAGVMVETSEGPQPIEWLRAGDLVLTRDNGYQPIMWVGRTAWDDPEALHPARIFAGALGRGTPAHDLIVSPAHNILLRSPLVGLHFGEDEVLAPACDIITQDEEHYALPTSEYAYSHILLEQHDLILTEGIWSESLFPDEETLERLGTDAAQEIRKVLGTNHKATQTARMVLHPGETSVLQPRRAIVARRMAA